MRFKITQPNCSYCKNKLTDWDYRFQGRHYCRICYERFFELTTCEKCKKQKKIFIFLSKRICKKCLVKDKPCIRCGKTKYKHGLISKYGPVCSSCSPYFRDYKKCTNCQKESYNVSNRTLLNRERKLLCVNCYNKTLPLCDRCHRQVKPYQTINEKNICRTCATQEDRICKQCQSPFPAGRGRICKDCSYDNILKRKTRQYISLLSSHTSHLFQGFSLWLKNRRGVLYASLHLQIYYEFFQELDDISKELSRFPTYQEIVQYLSVIKTRKYLLVTIYLHDIEQVFIDKIIQEEHANLDMIDRILQYFKKEDSRYQLLIDYYTMLKDKSIKNKTSIRSIRLALTPAGKFLKYCKHFEKNQISDEALSGYLWVYRGQKSAIYGFITFLNRHYGFSLTAHKNLLEISTPRYTKRQIKLKLIDLLKYPQDGQNYQQKLLRASLGYLHHIDLPNNAFIHPRDVKQNHISTYYLHLIGKKFFLPIEIAKQLSNTYIK